MKMQTDITSRLSPYSDFFSASRASLAIPVSLGRKLPLWDGRCSVKRMCSQKFLEFLSIGLHYFEYCLVRAWLSLTSICLISFSSALMLSKYPSRILSHGSCSVDTLLRRFLVPDFNSCKMPLNFSWLKLFWPMLLFPARITRSLIRLSLSIPDCFYAWISRFKDISVAFSCLF